MKTFGEKTVVDVIKLCCDRCGFVTEDVMEIQEFMSYQDTCGYGNRTFGDMSRISIDLCQDCVKTVLGEWMRVESPDSYWGNLDDLLKDQ